MVTVQLPPPDEQLGAGKRIFAQEDVRVSADMVEAAEQGLAQAEAQRAQIQAELDSRAQLAITNPGQTHVPSSAVLAQQLSEIADERANWQAILDSRTADRTTGRTYTLPQHATTVHRSRTVDYAPRVTTPQGGSGEPSQEGGRLDLHRGFDLPGIYVIGAQNPRDVRGREVWWKVGMSENVRERLRQHQVCFPQGYFIRLLLTLPPPTDGWRDKVLTRAVKRLESDIHRGLSAAPDVEHSTVVHSRGEWFRARFSSIYGVVETVLADAGLLRYVHVHDDLAGERYGVKSEDELHPPAGRLLPDDGRKQQRRGKVYSAIPRMPTA